MYFLICCSEDGDISIEKFEKEELLTALNAKDYGEVEFFTVMPDDRDPQYWKNKVLVIKGGIVTPKYYTRPE